MSNAMPSSALRFIVKQSGKYYLTREIWEFDPSMDTSGLQAGQIFWLKQIVALYGGPGKPDGVVQVGGGGACEASQITNGSGPGK